MRKKKNEELTRKEVEEADSPDSDISRRGHTRTDARVVSPIEGPQPPVTHPKE